MTSVNNSWQLKMLYNCLSTCSSVWEECQEGETQEWIPFYGKKDRQAAGDTSLTCVPVAKSHKVVTAFFPLQSGTINTLLTHQGLDRERQYFRGEISGP